MFGWFRERKRRADSSAVEVLRMVAVRLAGTEAFTFLIQRHAERCEAQIVHHLRGAESPEDVAAKPGAQRAAKELVEHAFCDPKIRDCALEIVEAGPSDAGPQFFVASVNPSCNVGIAVVLRRPNEEQALTAIPTLRLPLDPA